MAPTTLTARLTNAAGLHARPCHAIVATALEHDCTLRIRFEGREVNGRSILELMTLAAPQGGELAFVAEGPGAEACLAQLEGLVAGGFGESS